MKLSISELDLYRKGYVSIYITVTHACNLKCMYCYDEKVRERPMSLINVDRIISEVESLKLPRYFYDISGGELMLLDNWYEILDHFLKTGKDVSVNTNGTKINSGNIDKIIELNNKYPGKLYLSVSLDSLNPMLNQKIRLGSESNKVFDTLKLLTENRIRYRAAITLSSVNKDNILETVRDIVENYSKEVIIGVLRPTFNQCTHGHLMVKKEEIIRILQKIEDLKTLVGPFELYHCLDEDWMAFCEAGCDRICILPNGSVTPCYALQQNSDIVGNVYDEPLIEIIQRMHFMNYERDKRRLLCEHKEQCFGKPFYYLGT